MSQAIARRPSRAARPPLPAAYVGNGYWAPYRTHDYITVNMPGQADAGNPEHTGALWDGTTTTGAVYVNGEKVQDVDFQVVDFDVPAEQSKVRFEYNVEHDGAWMDTSTRTSTAWEFTTTRSEQNGEILPMLQAFYSTPLSDAGKAGADRKKGAPVPLHIELNHLGGALGAAAVKGATLEMHVAGSEWKTIPLKVESISQDGNGTPPDAEGFVTSRAYIASFSANLPTPDKGGYIDLRLTGTDEAGNSITQEIEKAVEVAPARGAK